MLPLSGDSRGFVGTATREAEINDTATPFLFVAFYVKTISFSGTDMRKEQKVQAFSPSLAVLRRPTARC